MSQTGLEITQPLKRISKKESKLAQMSNSDLKKKTFMKREFSQHICKQKQIAASLMHSQMIHSMKLINLVWKLKTLDPILCSREKLEIKRVSSKISKFKALLVEDLSVKFSWYKKLMMEKYMQ